MGVVKKEKAKQLLAENNCENFDLLINEIKVRFKECRVIFLIGSSGGGSGSAMLPATKKDSLQKQIRSYAWLHVRLMIM